MATYKVRQSGGDYQTVHAAAAVVGPDDIIEIDGPWTVDEDTAETPIDPDRVAIRAINESKCDPSELGNPGRTHWRKRKTSTSGHNFVVRGDGVVFDGLELGVLNNGNSNEAIRVDYSNVAHLFSLKDSYLWASSYVNDQDGVYLQDSGSIYAENSYSVGFGRSGFRLFSNSQDKELVGNLNSCFAFSNKGDDEGGGFTVSSTRRGTFTANLFNCVLLDNEDHRAGIIRDAATYGDADPTISVNLHSCVFGATATERAEHTLIETLCLPGRVATDSANPGADHVVLENITGDVSTYDLRLKSDPDNDAEDMHSTASALGLAMPAEDIVGTTRTAPYECGPFTIFTGVGPVVLVVDDMLHGHVVDGDLALQVGVSLSPNDALHGHAVDGDLALAPGYILYPNDALHGHAVDGDLALGQGFVISVDDALHGHLLDGDLNIGQGAFLSVAEILHNHPLEGDLGLGGEAFLVVEDMAHGHALEGNLGLVQGSILVPAGMVHGHALEGLVPLSQGYALAPADMLHGHGLEGPVALSQGYILLVADGLHSHILESPTLVLGSALSVADVFQGHSLEGPLGLSQSAILAPANALHGHLLDGVSVIPGFALTVDDLQHSHPLESPTLIHGLMVMPADVFHAHQLDGVNVSQSHILVVADCQHLHFVDPVNVIAGEFEPGCVTKVPVESRYILVPVENRTIKIKLC